MKLLKKGIDGFLLFFIIIMFSKLLNFFIVGDKSFTIEIGDIYLALLGFIYVVLLKSIENSSKPINDRFN